MALLSVIFLEMMEKSQIALFEPHKQLPQIFIGHHSRANWPRKSMSALTHAAKDVLPV
jgi:hypothetical protein